MNSPLKVESLNDAVLDRLAGEIAGYVIERAVWEIERSRAWKVLDQLDSVLAQDVSETVAFQLEEIYDPDLVGAIRDQMAEDPAARVLGRLDDLIADYRSNSNGGSQ